VNPSISRNLRFASRNKPFAVSLAALFAGLASFVTAGSAHAALQPCVTAGAGVWQCEPGDVCTLDCPQVPPTGNPSAWLDGWEKAVAAELSVVNNASFLEKDDWHGLFANAWQSAKTKYAASWALVLDPQDEPLLVDYLEHTSQVRAVMSSIFNLADAERIYLTDAKTLDQKWGEVCGDTAPADFDYTKGSLPGHWVVPGALTCGSACDGDTDFWEDVLQAYEHYDVDPAYNGHGMGRLGAEFRKAARAADAQDDLVHAALELARGSGQDCKAPARGNAYADLAVTGRRSFASFVGYAAKSTFQSDLVAAVQKSTPLPADGCTNPLQAETAVAMALDRAHKVANVIRVGSVMGSGEASYRASFGYIAVSGEDDPPYRPVNVPSAPFPQHDITVDVPLRWGNGTKAVTTRYFIAESGSATQISAKGWTIPSDPAPTLSDDAEVILYLPGLGSRAEEALDLTAALHGRASIDKKNYTVISVDLPNQGYSEKWSPFQVSPLSVIGHDKDTLGIPDFDAGGVHHVPFLDFTEDFVVHFVDTLDAAHPELALKKKIRAVVGGSLGGNLGLRLGRRDLPWLPKIVSWSPGSSWDSLADGADIFKHIGVRSAFNEAGGADPLAKNYANPPTLDGDCSKGPCDESPKERWNFFMTEYYRMTTHPLPVIPLSQPHLWYRNDWPCFAAEVQGGQLAAQETYHPFSRLTHWRLAAEQLVYSHAYDPELGHAPVLDNNTPMLLLTGGSDDYPYADIYDATTKLASQMSKTPGRFVQLGEPGVLPYVCEASENTGHSIHNERPNLLAALTAHFLQHDYVIEPHPVYAPSSLHVSPCQQYADAYGPGSLDPDPDCNTAKCFCMDACFDFCGEKAALDAECQPAVYTGSGCDCKCGG
jgi:hypothetical protein